MFWRPAEIEKWLQRNFYKDLKVDSYDVTIYPAESFKNKLTKKGQLRSHLSPEWQYEAEFTDLQGGNMEYVVTIVTVIGKSRMKGERIVTYLAPFGPEEHPEGLCYNIRTNSVQLRWELPKGHFMKYVLIVTAKEEDPIEKEFSKKLSRYTLTGLKQNKLYKATLWTKTGTILTKDCITSSFLTKPLPVEDLKVNVEALSVVIEWTADDECDDNIETVLQLKKNEEMAQESKSFKEVRLSSKDSSHTVTELKPLTSYTVSLTVEALLASYRSISDCRHVTFTTRPHPPTNLRLSHRDNSSLIINWNQPADLGHDGRYRVTISCLEGAGKAVFVEEKTAFTFALPETNVPGGWYLVQVVYCVTMAKLGSHLESVALEAVF